MEEKELKTSTKQRVIIGAIAVVMLGSIIAGYAAIVAGGNSGSSSSGQEISAEKKAQYLKEYQEKQTAFDEVSKADFEKFSPYLSEVAAYNETAANEAGLSVQDLVVGEGRELAEGDENYLAYYVGWCPDETVFDSSFDSTTSPTKFSGALDPTGGLIEGWDLGVVGMKLGGIREITIPGELAYKEKEMCGGTYKPLKFMVMAVENVDPLKTVNSELELATMKAQYAQYGLDYDDVAAEMLKAQGTGDSGDGSQSGDSGDTNGAEGAGTADDSESK